MKMEINCENIRGVCFLILMAVILNAAMTPICFSQEPSTAKKKAAVTQMMDKFNDTGSRFVLTESGVKLIDEERFLWSIAKLMTVKCQDCLANLPPEEVIRKNLANVRRYHARAKVISTDEEILLYYEYLDTAFQIALNLVNDLDDNDIWVKRKHKENNDRVSRFIRSTERGSEAKEALSKFDPNIGFLGGVLTVGWVYIQDDYTEAERSRDDLNDENRKTLRNARQQILKTTPTLEMLEKKIDTELRWESYAGASDAARNRKKAWHSQDFMMMLVTQAANSEAKSGDAFADCMYIAMMVPHDKIYDEYRAMALEIAFNALSGQKNYPQEYQPECLKLCLCFTNDADGSIRKKMMAAFLRMGKYRDVVTVGNEIQRLWKNDFSYSMTMALAHSELKNFDTAMTWFKLGIINTPPSYDVTELRTSPIFVKLRAARAKEFFETLEPRFSWKYTLGFVYDEFTITNKSPFPLHDVSLDVSLTGRDWTDAYSATWSQTFQTNYIAPGQSHTWNTSQGGHSLVRYRGNGSVTMKCRQHGGPAHEVAEKGNAEAQYNLGLCYARGDGVPRDFAEAVKWYRKAAEQNHTGAQYNLVHSKS